MTNIELFEEAKIRLYDLFKDGVIKINNLYLERVKRILENITLSEDVLRRSTANAKYLVRENKVAYSDSFLELNDETKIKIFIHELSHAISHSGNHYNPTFIEEGCANITAELAMDNYYKKNNITDNKDKYKKTDSYRYATSVMKTILIMLDNSDALGHFYANCIIGKDTLYMSRLFTEALGREAFEKIMEEQTNAHSIIEYDASEYDDLCKETSKLVFKHLDEMFAIPEFKEFKIRDVFKEDNELLKNINLSIQVEELIEENEGMKSNIDIMKMIEELNNGSFQFMVLDGYITKKIRRFMLENIEKYGKEEVYKIFDMIGICKIFEDNKEKI